MTVRTRIKTLKRLMILLEDAIEDEYYPSVFDIMTLLNCRISAAYNYRNALYEILDLMYPEDLEDT